MGFCCWCLVWLAVVLVLITFCFFVFDCYFDLDLWFAGFDWLFGVGCVWVGGLVVFVCIACG